MSTIAIDLTGTFGRPTASRRAPARVASAARSTARPGTASRPRPARVAAGERRTRPSGLRLTRRGRAVVVLGALLLAAGALLSAQVAQAEPPAAPVAVTTHTVTAGDTLWSLARTVAAPGEDLRDVVHELEELNGLPGASLTVGQLLLLPDR